MLSISQASKPADASKPARSQVSKSANVSADNNFHYGFDFDHPPAPATDKTADTPYFDEQKDLQQFFLPAARPDADRTALIGRKVHWFSLAASIVMLLGAMWINFHALGLALSFACLAMWAWLIGRGCRYILAGE